MNAVKKNALVRPISTMITKRRVSKGARRYGLGAVKREVFEIAEKINNKLFGGGDGKGASVDIFGVFEHIASCLGKMVWK